MDRETRKINLKKLQLPTTSGYKQRTRQTTKTKTTSTAITNYFLTPEKPSQAEEIANISDLKHNKEPQKSDINLNTESRAKRTKLDDFIFKDPKNMPDSIKKAKNSLKNEDFIQPEQKVKRAPKLSQTKSSKSARTKKQTTIKSAFLRNEQLFAEIAAQHCAADQFDGDDVQLALAISKSELERKGIQIPDENVIDHDINLANDNDADSIRDKLKQYGFRTSDKKDYNTFAAAFLPKLNNRRPKSKWANKFTALTLRSSENQMKKLQENIAKLLSNQFHIKSLCNNEKCLNHYELQSSLLKMSVGPENKRVLKTNGDVNQSNELFFVSELFVVNKLPAGYLLKDWTAIQGRDLTPNSKNKQTMEKMKMLETIYQDLEEFFSSRKRLDWSRVRNDNGNQEILTNNTNCTNNLEKPKESLNTSQIAKKVENVESTNEMIKVTEVLYNNEKSDGINTETSLSPSECNSNILQLLPTAKSLDRMQVSSCSINTQATINTTQKNRSNSPDLFADSDVEMEETDNADQDIKTKDRLGTDVVTYEIFSSDEVKNSPLLEANKPIAKALSPNTPLHTVNVKVVDLTQDDLQLTANLNLNESKLIEEIDLFAESPLGEYDQDAAVINGKSQAEENKTETFKFTLSLETNDKYLEVKEKTAEEAFSLEIEKQLEDEEDDEIVLREMVMNQTSTSFLNFQGSKQLETSFHRKTASAQNDSIKDNDKGNDTIFRELCNKYLNPKSASVNKRDINKSFSQVLPKNYDDFTNFTMDLDMTANKTLTLKRKSRSFTSKTPLKNQTNDSNTFLYKSQLLRKHHSNANIDLRQNNVGDSVNDNVEFEDEDDDDCLILSDDEINYSIWQANKTLNFQNATQDAVISLSDTESASEEENTDACKEKVIEFPNQYNDKKEFSFLELHDKKKSWSKKISSPPKDCKSNIKLSTVQYAKSTSLTRDELTFERSEFGILEEYSQPIDYTPNLCTPTKVLNEASFLSSPTETTAPMKRYSNYRKSSQKFHDLINNIETKSPPLAGHDFNDFDEFDCLVYTSPLKSVKSSDKPQGIDQLLTAEISFRESPPPLAKTTKNLDAKLLDKNTQEIKCNNKTYLVRYTDTPKPDYDKYTEAELLKELYNFGIKPLKRKQAIKILEYIFNQTHPVLKEEQEQENSLDNQKDILTLDELEEKPCTSKQALKTKNLATKAHENFISSSIEIEKERAVQITVVASKKLDLKDSCGLEMLRYSYDLKAELSDEKYILQTNISKKTPQPLLPLHIAWYNLVCSNRKLHENIVMYEPIDLQEVYLFLKKLGYRYDPKDLKLFFDRRCIIFRYEITPAGVRNGKTKDTNRHVRRKGKKTKISKS